MGLRLDIIRLDPTALALAAVIAVTPAAADSVPGDPDPALRAALAQAIDEGESFADRFDAEVWLLDMSQRLARRAPATGTEERLTILRLVHREAARADLPPELVLAVIEVESNFDRFAVSRAGAQGLMQVMSFWLDELDVEHANLFDPALNLRMGCTILRHYLDRENGDIPRALARYNGSAGQTWYPDRVLTALSDRWFRQ